LDDLYVTAVVHWAPPDNRPTPAEVSNCRPYFRAHLTGLPRLRVVIALGQIAFQGVLDTLRASGQGLPSPRPRFSHGGETKFPAFTLLASYHPSRQNTQTGRLTPPMFDRIFLRAQELLR
jgi:uracil-DNA glycosylase family 4